MNELMGVFMNELKLALTDKLKGAEDITNQFGDELNEVFGKDMKISEWSFKG